MTVNEYAEAILNENVSLKTMISNQLKRKSLDYFIDKMKNHFGIEMRFSNERQIKIVTKWVEEVDPKNFKYHISNPYDYKKNDNPQLKGEFILHIDTRTFIFISVGGKDKDKGIYMYIFGKKAFKWFKIIANKAQYANDTNMMYSISARNSEDGQYWTCVGSTFNSRPMDTLFFDKDIKNKICKHLDDWLANEEVYKDRGLTFKTGILLYGVAGTGKSSLASAIATYLNCGLITIDTATFADLNITEVVESINADNNRYVILIDEIDTIFTSRDEDNITDSQKVRTSKLLSLLDSQQSPNNVIFVATTNYVNKLDKTVIRKGRFDMSIELGNISKDTAMEMCKSFNLTKEQSMKAISEFEGREINPAELQNVILTVISDAKKVIA
ncbi:MAG TPA: hypothetical protein DCW90_08680 [Lachnospiraceae bacterium]|nr:hypothetical protein [Lachnospiraceae bacterium]